MLERGILAKRGERAPVSTGFGVAFRASRSSNRDQASTWRSNGPLTAFELAFVGRSAISSAEPRTLYPGARRHLRRGGTAPSRSGAPNTSVSSSVALHFTNQQAPNNGFKLTARGASVEARQLNPVLGAH